VQPQAAQELHTTPGSRVHDRPSRPISAELEHLQAQEGAGHAFTPRTPIAFLSRVHMDPGHGTAHKPASTALVGVTYSDRVGWRPEDIRTG
jgi:hypothetical protein